MMDFIFDSKIMNSKVFGTVNANTWARGDEMGNQFNVLNGISNPNSRSSVVDVCQLCKNPGETQLSPDSDVYIDEGCRCSVSQAPDSTTGGAVIDVAEVATKPESTQEQELEQESDYVESSPVVDAVASGSVGNKYISENNTVAPSDLTQSVAQQQEQPVVQQSDEPIEIIGKDEGAIEKFYSGQMTPLEYSINITIIILFIAISLMAIMMIFKLAYCKCLSCGSKCSHVCPRCGRCEQCCRCHEVPVNQSQPLIQKIEPVVNQSQPQQQVEPITLTGGYFSRNPTPTVMSNNQSSLKPVSLSGSIF